MATLVASFIYAYNIDHLPTLALIELAWVLIEFYWWQQWTSALWREVLPPLGIGLVIGWIMRASQRRRVYLRIMRRDVLSGENLNDLRAVALSALLTFLGLLGYADVIEMSGHTDWDLFPLGRFRSLIVCVLLLLFIFVCERKWRDWVALEQLDAGTIDSETAARATKPLDWQYLLQAMLVSIIILGDATLYIGLHRSWLLAPLIGLLVLYLTLLYVFKWLMLSKSVVEKKRQHGA